MGFRRRILDISQTVGALHAAPAFSCLEAVDVIYYGLMRKDGDGNAIDRFLMSKGHGCMSQYVILEDRKAAGFEPVDVRSGYVRSGLSAYRELRDEHVAFFVQRLPRGTSNLTYRVRAEIPGKYSALPTRAYAMYAPELRANSAEFKLNIQD